MSDDNLIRRGDAMNADWATGKDVKDDAPKFLSDFQRGFVAGQTALRETIAAVPAVPADLPPTDAQVMAHPKVRELIEAAEKLGLRKMVAGWNGEGLPEPYKPHAPHLWATIKTTCGVVYEIDAALAAFEVKP